MVVYGSKRVKVQSDALFPINRYRGEEEDETEAGEEGETEAGDDDEVELPRLNVNKRSRREVSDEDGEKPRKKRTKKEKVKAEDGEESSAKPSTPAKKVKKKKKRVLANESTSQEAKAPSAEDVDEENEDEEEEQAIEEEDGEKKRIEEFTVIDPAVHAIKQKVKRILPDWLAKPTVINQSYDNLLPVTDLACLDLTLVEALQKNAIQSFFPVQQLVIPALCESFEENFYRPRDICVSAPTGSGKTLAFVLPIINSLKGRVDPQIRALVVLPVQELAKQVYEVFRQYVAGTDLKVMLLQGQTSFAAEQQNLVRKGIGGHFLSKVDILVCAPGRLMMHIASTPGFTLQHVRYFVIDEADRVMDSVDKNWMHHLERALRGPHAAEDKVWDIVTVETLKRHARLRPSFPQKLLFSATLSQNPEKLEEMNLFMPRLFTSVTNQLPPKLESGEEILEGEAVDDGEGKVESDTTKGDFIGQYTTPPGLKELYLECEAQVKPLVVHRLVTTLKWKGVLCFTGERDSSRRLCKVLEKLGGVTVGEFSSLLSRVSRGMMMKRFARGDLDVLVTSDAMARGIDLPQVNYVLNYDCSPHITTYIHRVGRTARAGKEGTALSLLAEHEVTRFWSLMEEGGKSSRLSQLDLKLEDLEAMEEEYKAALDEVREGMEADKATVDSRKGKSKKYLNRRLVGKRVGKRRPVQKKRQIDENDVGKE